MFMLVTVLTIVGISDSADSERLIRLHEESLSQIHSLRATLESHQTRDGGRTWTPVYEMWVRKSGQKERFHKKTYGYLFSGRWIDGISFQDQAYSSTEMRLLSGVDPRNPPKEPLTGADATRITGMISVPDPYGPHGRKNAWTVHLMFVPDNAYSLRELFQASRNKTVMRGLDDEGNETWDFHLDSRDGEYTHVVSLSPKRNYAISKLSMSYGGNPEAEISPYEYVASVVEWHEISPRFSIPKLIRMTNRYEPDLLSEQVIHIEEVNMPIPDEELELEFPVGTIVNDSIRNVFHIWGANGPERSFRSREEFRDVIEARRAERMRSYHKGSSVPWSSIFAVITVSVLLAALIYWRRWLVRQSREGGTRHFTS